MLMLYRKDNFYRNVKVWNENLTFQEKGREVEEAKPITTGTVITN